MPPATTSEAYRHLVAVMTMAEEAVFGPPGTPDTVLGLVSSAANVFTPSGRGTSPLVVKCAFSP